MKLQWLVRILLRHFPSAFSPPECRPTRLFGGQNRLIIFSLTNVSGHSLFLHKSPLCSGKIAPFPVSLIVSVLYSIHFKSMSSPLRPSYIMLSILCSNDSLLHNESHTCLWPSPWTKYTMAQTHSQRPICTNRSHIYKLLTSCVA